MGGSSVKESGKNLVAINQCKKFFKRLTKARLESEIVSPPREPQDVAVEDITRKKRKSMDSGYTTPLRRSERIRCQKKAQSSIQKPKEDEEQWDTETFRPAKRTKKIKSPLRIESPVAGSEVDHALPSHHESDDQNDEDDSEEHLDTDQSPLYDYEKSDNNDDDSSNSDVSATKTEENGDDSDSQSSWVASTLWKLIDGESEKSEMESEESNHKSSDGDEKTARTEDEDSDDNDRSEHVSPDNDTTPTHESPEEGIKSMTFSFDSLTVTHDSIPIDPFVIDNLPGRIPKDIMFGGNSSEMPDDSKSLLRFAEWVKTPRKLWIENGFFKELYKNVIRPTAMMARPSIISKNRRILELVFSNRVIYRPSEPQESWLCHGCDSENRGECMIFTIIDDHERTVEVLRLGESCGKKLLALIGLFSVVNSIQHIPLHSSAISKAHSLLRYWEKKCRDSVSHASFH